MPENADIMNDASPLERARDLVLRHGWNSTSYQITNPGIDLWFSRRPEGVVGYVLRHRVRVAAGAPVCAAEALREVAAAFERDAERGGERVCYFCAEGRLDDLYRGSADHSMVYLGAQPVWHPGNWGSIISGHASLRAQLNRARNKGVRVEEWPSERATKNPELCRVLGEWLATRGLPPLHFLVEPETLERLFDRRVFVALRGDDVIGFLIASPVAMRNGWLIEQNIRGAGAPNGTAELMIDAAMRTLGDEGSSYVTLGLAPLSRRAGVEDHHDPLWLRLLLAWTRAHGRRFYNFDGLDTFKAKFRPEWWEPVYAISNEPSFSIRSLYAIAAAFSDGSPIVLLLRAIARALRTELGWLIHGGTRGPGSAVPRNDAVYRPRGGQ
jgi:phosphatidylglycerol lysyltransferase